MCKSKFVIMKFIISYTLGKKSESQLEGKQRKSYSSPCQNTTQTLPSTQLNQLYNKIQDHSGMNAGGKRREALLFPPLF